MATLSAMPSCRCPASCGEDCSLTPGECAARRSDNSLNPVPARDPDTAAKLSAITKAYIRDRDIKDARETLNSPFWDLLKRNAGFKPVPPRYFSGFDPGPPVATQEDARIYGAGFYRVKDGVTEHIPAASVFVREPEVTPEMVTAGMSALRTPCSPDYELVPAIYRAMTALKPVYEPIYNGGPDHLAALARERDSALAAEDEYRRQRNNILEEATRYVHEATAQLAAKDATIAGLKSQLAAFKASNVPPVDPKPLAHNPFKADDRDRRRMGP